MERGSRGGRGDGDGEREQPPGREQKCRGGMNTQSQTKTPQDNGTSRRYQHNRVLERTKGGGETPTRREIHHKGRGESGNVTGYVPTPEDLRLREVYRVWVHGNPGTHLDGGVKDDSAWQAWWRDVVFMPSRRYNAPSGKVGPRFVGTLGVEMQGVQDGRWNSERLIIFQTVILQLNVAL